MKKNDLAQEDISAVSALTVTRMTPNEFRAEIVRKGWKASGLAVRWDISRSWISMVSRRENRPRYWDDAIRGLPDISDLKDQISPLSLMTPDQFRSMIEQKGWTYVELGQRWSLTSNWLAKLGLRLNRPRYWDDVIRGIPDRLVDLEKRLAGNKTSQASVQGRSE